MSYVDNIPSNGREIEFTHKMLKRKDKIKSMKKKEVKSNMGWHEDTVKNIGKYCEQFSKNVQIHVSDKKPDTTSITGKNCFPLIENNATRKNQLYCPDITVKDEDDQITHFIEIVDSSPGSPVSVLGVIFAADIAITIMMKNKKQQQSINPKLFFVIQDPKEKYDQYWCNICEYTHTKRNKNYKNCMDWMKKKDDEIEKIDVTLKRIPCPICKRNHWRNHKHIIWLNNRSSQNNAIEEIKTENKWTRLFDKTIKNEEVEIEIKNKIKHIEFPIICYDTNYDSCIKF